MTSLDNLVLRRREQRKSFCHLTHSLSVLCVLLCCWIFMQNKHCLNKLQGPHNELVQFEALKELKKIN